MYTCHSHPLIMKITIHIWIRVRKGQAPIVITAILTILLIPLSKRSFSMDEPESMRGAWHFETALNFLEYKELGESVARGKACGFNIILDIQWFKPRSRLDL